MTLTTVTRSVVVDADDLERLVRLAHQADYWGSVHFDDDPQWKGCSCGSNIDESNHPAHVEWCVREARRGRIEFP